MLMTKKLSVAAMAAPLLTAVALAMPAISVAQAPVPVAPSVRGLPDFTDLVEQVGPAVVNIRTVERARADAGLNAALVSLLNNAADASPDQVAVEADWNAAAFRVSVLDRGPGLSDDRLARAGYDFVSTKGETRGLGLALARAGIERLGGTLTVARRDGGGLRATLQWPRLDSTQ